MLQILISACFLSLVIGLALGVLLWSVFIILKFPEIRKLIKPIPEVSKCECGNFASTGVIHLTPEREHDFAKARKEAEGDY